MNKIKLSESFNLICLFSKFFLLILFLQDLNSPLLFGRLNGLSSDSTIDILYQLGTTQDPGTKDRYVVISFFT